MRFQTVHIDEAAAAALERAGGGDIDEGIQLAVAELIQINEAAHESWIESKTLFAVKVKNCWDILIASAEKGEKGLFPASKLREIANKHLTQLSQETNRERQQA